jgi:cystathionine beta-lyase/cystathionine gamma-synthase
MMRLMSVIATKYFGGHSDLLSGVLVVRTKEEWDIVRLLIGGKAA